MTAIDLAEFFRASTRASVLVALFALLVWLIAHKLSDLEQQITTINETIHDESINGQMAFDNLAKAIRELDL